MSRVAGWLEPITTRARLLQRNLTARKPASTTDQSVVPTTPTAGVPLPPARLRHLVAGTSDPEDFLLQGQRHADLIAALAASAGAPIKPGITVADIGCGCGRLTRHWLPLGAHIVAGEVNRQLLDWVGTNMAVTTFRIGRKPPTSLPGDSIDVLVAYSVLTHLRLRHQRAWLADWQRVVKAGGVIICTTHGTSRQGGLTTNERLAFDAGQVVVRHPSASGANLCSTYLPPSAASDLFSPLEIVDHREPDPQHEWDQDIWVLKKRG